MLAGLPRDVRLAALAAAVVLVAGAYEFSPIAAMLVAIALCSAFVAAVVGRD
ncbi:MAG TPA: hypothetical protein VHD34_08270 [Xanthobacteraceae bacterium]|nr:hypothetical protein [Xanthobacteraceae bacterium]